MSALEQGQYCRSCGAAIVWLKHVQTGKLAPIDKWPSAEGDCVINLEAGTYAKLTKEDRAAYHDWLHINHFATCPQAPQWKRHGSVREVEP